MFHLDDDMVDMITAGQVFDVEVEESEENPGKQVLVLINFFKKNPTYQKKLFFFSGYHAERSGQIVNCSGQNCT